MKSISKEEFNEYLEYKRFMDQRPGEAAKGSDDGALSLDELDQVAAARSDREFSAFLNEMKQRRESGEK
jgi:uncharacterized protein YfeS